MICLAQDERERVVVEISNPSLAIVRLNRTAERNALSIATLEALNKVVDELIQQADITAIIFTGTQDAFASGANIRELACLTPATAKEFAMRGQRLFQKIADAPQLTIAAINGYCMGGGLDLALACAAIFAALRAMPSSLIRARDSASSQAGAVHNVCRVLSALRVLLKYSLRQNALQPVKLSASGW